MGLAVGLQSPTPRHARYVDGVTTGPRIWQPGPLYRPSTLCTPGSLAHTGFCCRFP